MKHYLLVLSLFALTVFPTSTTSAQTTKNNDPDIIVKIKGTEAEVQEYAMYLHVNLQDGDMLFSEILTIDNTNKDYCCPTNN